MTASASRSNDASASRSLTENEAVERLLAFSERCRSCRHNGHNGIQERCHHQNASLTVVAHLGYRGLTAFDVGYSAGWVAAGRPSLPSWARHAAVCPPCTLYERASQ